MKKYIIRQEYFGATALNTENFNYTFFKQRETDMLKLLQYCEPKKALQQMAKSVDKSIGEQVSIDMHNFVLEQKDAGILDSEYKPNYDLRTTPASELMYLPRGILKAPLRIYLQLPAGLAAMDSDARNSGNNRNYLSRDEINMIIDEMKAADVLELRLAADASAHDSTSVLRNIADYAARKGIVTSIDSKCSGQTQKFEGHPAFDIYLNECNTGLKIQNDGELARCDNAVTKYKNNGLRNIRDYNYSILDAWHDSENVQKPALIGNTNTHNSIWND